MNCHVAVLGHNESALLFALLWALSQGVILPERQKTLCLCRDPCIFPTHFLIHFVNCLAPPLSLCYVSCELQWKSVCDRHFQYLVSCQTSTRWKTSNMALDSQTHTHTQREMVITGYCSGPSMETETKQNKKTMKKVLLYVWYLSNKEGIFNVFVKIKHVKSKF